MKSLLKMLLVVALLSGAEMLHAYDRVTTTKIEHAGAKSIALYLEFPVAAAAQVGIRDAQGSLVFSEHYRDVTTLARKINLANLPKGTYFVEVEGPQKIQVYEVRLSEEQLLIEAGRPATFFKPSIQRNGNFLDITMLLLDEPVTTVNILNSGDELLLTEVVQNSKTLEKRFNLSKLRPGVYQVVVTAGGRSFSQSFTVR